jgi:hypothetical protein
MFDIEPTLSLIKPRLKNMPALSGPALVLASGPGAAVPSDFNERWTLATVNGSQAVAARLGLGSPDVTLMGTSILRNKDAQEVLRGKRTGTLICVRDKKHRDPARIRLAFLKYSYSGFFFLTRQERLRLLSEMVGESVASPARPSNGVILALLALHLGCEKVIMTGFSLTKDGHAYNNKGCVRGHKEQDRHILGKVVQRKLPIFTNQPDFSAESGIPLV